MEGLKFLNDLGKTHVDSSSVLTDLLNDYSVLRIELFNQIDPSVRIKLQAPGLEIIQNIYTGYDTEYQLNESTSLNDLISSQLAVSTKTLLKITDRSIEYEFSAASTLGSDVYKKRGRSDPIAYIRLL